MVASNAGATIFLLMQIIFGGGGHAKRVTPPKMQAEA